MLTWRACTTLLLTQHLTWLWQQDSCAGTPGYHDEPAAVWTSTSSCSMSSERYLSRQRVTTETTKGVPVMTVPQEKPFLTNAAWQAVNNTEGEDARVIP